MVTLSNKINPLDLKVVDLIELKKNLVIIKKGNLILEGRIGTIYIASNDTREFGSFDFEPTLETMSKNVEVPTNLTAFEIQEIVAK